MKMLDHINRAMSWRRSPVANGTLWVRAADYFHQHRLELCPQFDLWLVAMRDELAHTAGTPEWRFCERVVRMNALQKDALAGGGECSQCHKPVPSVWGTVVCGDCVEKESVS